MKKIIFVFVLLLNLPTIAQIPSPKEFLGYELGTHYTPHYKIVQYFQAVAQASPATIRLEEYGTTNARRPLLLAYISSAENINNLENIRQNNLRLAGLENGNGNTTNAKVIVWLSYNVHGNEPSSSETAMATIYELLTSSSTNAKEWLKNTVVIMDPCLNPDGRDRYVSWFNDIVGTVANPALQSREHSEPWPNGRTNHYNFDLNRDWAWQTQIETQQRIKKFNQWMPQIHCDYHEQEHTSPYYFAPATEPFHEVISPWQREFQSTIGKNHARYFDANGWLYFTKEHFDLLYPGYGDTWPMYNGSIGMTYEQAGNTYGGRELINEDGDTLTLKDRIAHHYTTGISTIEAASLNADKLVSNFKFFFNTAKNNGVGEYKTFVIKGKSNPCHIRLLTNLLDKNGIQYGHAYTGTATGLNYFNNKTENFHLDQTDLLVSTMQPRGNMVKVLFEPISKITDSVTYDITAWSLPYAYGLQAYAVKDKLPSRQQDTIASSIAIEPNVYGFIAPWQSLNDVCFLTTLMKKNIKVRQASKPFEINGITYPAGTLLILKTANKNVIDFQSVVLKSAVEFNVSLSGVKTGFMDKGSDFGSSSVKTLWPPQVACLTGDGVTSTSAGEVWHYFEKEINYPITMINASDINEIDWRKLDVLIVPDGRYKNLFLGVSQLKSWIQQGGKLIVLENAVSELANTDWGLKIKKDDDEYKEKNEYVDLKKYDNEERDFVKGNNPGSIFKVDLDNSHPLAFGYPDFYYTLKTNNKVYEFLKTGWNVGVIKKDNQVAGFTGVDAKRKLIDGTLIGHINMNKGAVVFFADDPLFRGFWQNGKLLFANAVFIVKAPPL